VYENHPARLASTTSDVKFADLVPAEDLEDDMEEERMVTVADNGVKFNWPDQIQRFLREMEVPSGNPFPGRCVWLLLEESSRAGVPLNREELLESFRQLLIRFGEHIWYLRLSFHCFDVLIHSNEYETLLMSWLTLVPNLKRLKLKLACARDEDEGDGLNTDFWRENPVQKLNNLQVFSYTNEYDQHKTFTPLIHQLLERFCVGGNLTRLHLPDNCNGPDFPFPNLKELWT